MLESTRVMTAALFALLTICPHSGPTLASAVEEAAARYRLNPVALAVLVAAESTCNPTAVNRRSGAVGLMGIAPQGSANPRRLTTTALLRPAVNLDLGAAQLARLLELCGSMGAALTLYHGGGHKDVRGRTKCQVDDHARKLLRRIRSITERFEQTQKETT
jgi:soluble lytic murein transglycosylase-like protein